LGEPVQEPVRADHLEATHQLGIDLRP
jgi:hypothetical protein